MNLKQLTYFVEVAKERSYTRAASQLYLSQPALSKVIKNMEQELGVHLIDRTSKVFALTNEGQIFYENGEKALQRINEELDHLYDGLSDKRGKVRVGVPAVISTMYFTSTISEFKKEHTGICVEMTEGGANHIREMVSDGSIDVGVVILPLDSSEFDVTPVIQEANVLIVHKDHPLASNEFVHIRDLANENFISLNQDFMLYDKIKELCVAEGFIPNFTYLSSQWDFVAEMVALNEGIAILPEPILSRFNSFDQIKKLKLVDPEFPWNIAFIVKKSKYMSYAIKEFIHFVKQRYEEREPE